MLLAFVSEKCIGVTMWTVGSTPTSVPDSSEIRRVRDLPWHTQDLSQGLADRLTSLLRAPGGAYQIRPIQAEALAQLARLGGLFATIPPGGGKTLITLLASSVLHMRGDGAGDRVLLLVPGATVPKTLDAATHLSRHFIIRPFRILSYSMLSMKSHANFLAEYQPTCVIMDEAHHLKDPSGARWKRLRRYDRTCATLPIYAAMSGSFSTRGLSDFRHILWRCLREGAPVTRDPMESRIWGFALDAKVPDYMRIEPGALSTVAPADPTSETTMDSPLTRARSRFGRRLRHTLGVVSYGEGFPPCELHVRAEHVPPPSAVTDALDTIRSTAELPCGYPIPDMLSMWRHVRELSTGMVQRWRVPAPPEWLAARREWCSYVRQTIAHSRTVDTEAQVRAVVERGERRDDGALLLRTWLDVEPTFIPDPEPVWISDYRLTHAAEWLQSHPRGIVWTSHIPFGTRLSEITGVPYFPAAGRIDTHTGPAIASIRSCGTGLDLQHRHADNYIVTPPTMGAEHEQLLARTHRDGQTRPKVTAVYALSLDADVSALDQALRDARMAEPVLQAPQRLLMSDIADIEKVREQCQI